MRCAYYDDQELQADCVRIARCTAAATNASRQRARWYTDLFDILKFKCPPSSSLLLLVLRLKNNIVGSSNTTTTISGNVIQKHFDLIARFHRRPSRNRLAGVLCVYKYVHYNVQNSIKNLNHTKKWKKRYTLHGSSMHVRIWYICNDSVYVQRRRGRTRLDCGYGGSASSVGGLLYLPWRIGAYTHHTIYSRRSRYACLVRCPYMRRIDTLATRQWCGIAWLVDRITMHVCMCFIARGCVLPFLYNPCGWWLRFMGRSS